MDPVKKKQEEVEISGSFVYLVLYNIIQSLGWTLLSAGIFTHYLSNGHVGLYALGGTALNVFQSLAFLEVIHAATGLVRTNVVLTTFQVLSRLFLTWGITYSVTEIQDNIGVTMFMLAWSLTEIVRYSYYTCAQMKNIPFFLQWARYTLFIVLYPLGVSGELKCIYAALPYLKSSQMYSIALPNRGNLSFNYHYMCVLVMFMYIPIFPQLYGHMLTQRKKILGTPRPKTQ